MAVLFVWLELLYYGASVASVEKIGFVWNVQVKYELMKSVVERNDITFLAIIKMRMCNWGKWFE